MTSTRLNSNGGFQRVAVTGVGLVTPFGVGRATSWRGMLSGESATRNVGGLVGAPAAHFVEAESAEPVGGLALTSAREAVEDAGLNLPDAPRERIGCVIGTSKPGLRSYGALRDSPGSDDQAAELWRRFLPNHASLAVAAELGLAGPVLCPVAACATGLVSLLRGVDLIREGVCDVVLAGSSDASLVPVVLASFQRMGVLARRSGPPESACRPFDRERSGFVVGEGAAVLVLERFEHAAARGATIYAEWLAGGTAADGSTLTGLQTDGEALARLIGDVLRRAGVSADEVDYINLHGTATRQNDLYETRAARRALGPAAYTAGCSSQKGGVGHLLGAAGSVETAATLFALRDGVVPPTANLETPDPECDLDYTPREPRRRPITTALKLSLGFGGHLAAAVLRRHSG